MGWERSNSRVAKLHDISMKDDSVGCILTNEWIARKRKPKESEPPYVISSRSMLVWPAALPAAPPVFVLFADSLLSFSPPCFLTKHVSSNSNVHSLAIVFTMNTFQS